MKFFLSKISKLFESGNFIILVGILSILPFLVISIFNNPSADDFCFNCQSRDLGFWEAQLSWYNGWTGRYFSTAILSIKPLISEPFLLYKLIPVILITALGASLYYLSSLLLVKLKKKDFFILTFFIMVLYLIKMPSISEGFYWLAGSITYQLANIISIMFLCFLIKLIETNEKKYLIFSILCTILIIGSNETSMLLIDFFIVVIFIFKYLQLKKIDYSILIILIFAIIFSLIVIISPGNTVRALSFPNNHLIIDSTFNSIIAAYSFSIKLLPIIIISSLIYFDYFNVKINISTSKIFTVNPILLFIIIFFIPLIGFFASFWSMGDPPQQRTINTIYFYFLLGIIYLTLVLFFKSKESKNSFMIFSKWFRYLILLIIISELASQNNIRNAYSNLISGSAYEYNLALKNRYEKIRNNKGNICYVPELVNKPITINFDDITSNPENWKNSCYASYFMVEKIIAMPNND